VCPGVQAKRHPAAPSTSPASPSSVPSTVTGGAAARARAWPSSTCSTHSAGAPQRVKRERRYPASSSGCAAACAIRSASRRPISTGAPEASRTRAARPTWSMCMWVSTCTRTASHPPAAARTPASSADHAGSVPIPPSTSRNPPPASSARYACTWRGGKGIGVEIRHTPGATDSAGSAGGGRTGSVAPGVIREYGPSAPPRTRNSCAGSAGFLETGEWNSRQQRPKVRLRGLAAAISPHRGSSRRSLGVSYERGWRGSRGSSRGRMEFAATRARSPPSRTSQPRYHRIEAARVAPLGVSFGRGWRGNRGSSPRRRTSGSCCRGFNRQAPPGDGYYPNHGGAIR
jgi:hypothetical protein